MDFETFFSVGCLVGLALMIAGALFPFLLPKDDERSNAVRILLTGFYIGSVLLAFYWMKSIESSRASLDMDAPDWKSWQVGFAVLVALPLLAVFGKSIYIVFRPKKQDPLGIRDELHRDR
jgi:hypothetical protein